MVVDCSRLLVQHTKRCTGQI